MRRALKAWLVDAAALVLLGGLLFASVISSSGRSAVISDIPDAAISEAAFSYGEVLLDGPQGTKAFISDYFADHPEVMQEAEKYMGVLDEVKNFQQKHPDAQDGTYSAVTGEPVELDSGYSVTFHQNLSLDDPYGAYDAEDYAAMCAIAKNELDSDDVYIGYFGNAEVSFNCADKEKAMTFAVRHNQHCVYDCKNDKIILNEKCNNGTNPVEEA